MERIFNQDGWLYRGLNRLWDLIVLNILFFLTSIPIVTVGASLSALYTVTLKGVRKEDSYIVRSYFAAFRENFKNATLMWLLLLAVWLVWGTDVFVLGKNHSLLVFLGGIFGTIWLLITLYAFALQAWFENSLRNTLANALFVSLKFLPCTVQLAGMFAVVPILCVMLAVLSPEALGWTASVFLFCGVSGIAWVTSFPYRKVFDQLAEKSD